VMDIEINEDVKIGKAYGVARRKARDLPWWMEEEEGWWWQKFLNFDNLSVETLVMDRMILKHLMKNEWWKVGWPFTAYVILFAIVSLENDAT
jgi:hypothetical protein